MKILSNGIAVIENDEAISKWVEASGTLGHWDGADTLFVKHVPENGTVVDVGAFIGDHTECYLKKVGPSGRVLAFEPNQKAFECLLHNCPKAESYPCGLGKTFGRKFFNESVSNAGGSCLSDEKNSIAVMVLPLDAFNLEKVDYLKIDAEGDEMDILIGAIETIKRSKPTMIIELNRGMLELKRTSAEDILKFVKELGYSVSPLYSNLSLTEILVDVLCLPT